MATKRVLIADDTNLIRKLVANFLRQRPDIEVCGEAINGLEAIEKAKILKPDLVLLDVSMPIMSGIEAAAILKKHLPNTAIILFSLTSDPERPAIIQALGIDAVVVKTNGLVAVAETIDSVLERRKRPASKDPVSD